MYNNHCVITAQSSFFYRCDSNTYMLQYALCTAKSINTGSTDVSND